MGALRATGDATGQRLDGVGPGGAATHAAPWRETADELP